MMQHFVSISLLESGEISPDCTFSSDKHLIILCRMERIFVQSGIIYIYVSQPAREEYCDEKME